MFRKLPFKVDLLALIELAIPQVFGSDERRLLEAFVDRVRATAGPDEQIEIEIDLLKILLKNNEPDG